MLALFGGEVRQIQFQFDPQRLVQYGVSVEEVIAAARRATGVRGAGFVDTPNQRIVLQTEGQSITAAGLSHTVLIHHSGANVTLRDIARVADAPAPIIGAASIGGKPGVILVVDAAYGSNTLEITQGIDKALADRSWRITSANPVPDRDATNRRAATQGRHRPLGL